MSGNSGRQAKMVKNSGNNGNIAKTQNSHTNNNDGEKSYDFKLVDCLKD